MSRSGGARLERRIAHVRSVLRTGCVLGVLLVAGCAPAGGLPSLASSGPPGRQTVHRQLGPVSEERPLRLRHVFDAGPGGALDVAFSPDGAALAAAGADGDVRLWSTATGRLRWSTARFDGRSGDRVPVFRIAVSPTGSVVAAGHADGRVVLRSLQTGRELGTLPGQNWVEALAFAPDATRLAVGASDGHVRVWDLRTHEPVRALGGHSGLLFGLAYSPDGARLASGDTAGTVKLWDTASDEPVWTLAMDAPVVRLGFSPNGGTLAVAGYDITRLLDAASGRILQTLAHPGAAQSVVFSPDGATLTTAAGAGVVVSWRVATGARLGAHRARTAGPSVMALGPRARLLASAGLVDDDVRLWEAG